MGRAEPHARRASRGTHSEAFVGIDISKMSNAVAAAEAGRGLEVRYLGAFDSSEAATRKWVARLAAWMRRPSSSPALRVAARAR